MRDSKTTTPLPKGSPVAIKAKASVGVNQIADVAVISVSGLVDENFSGFGTLGQPKMCVLDVTGMTRMTSFGVRQWLRAMDALPRGISDLYLVGCPTFFVDQLNMVLNFGGVAQVLSVLAPYTCPACGAESAEKVDVRVERANLAKGGVPELECAKCGGKLEFDETPESYFGFVKRYAATQIRPEVAVALAQLGLYSATDAEGERPPRIIKLVHNSVTYFRVVGTIGSMFRSRPFVVGAEGEIVIDVAEVDRFDVLGQREWRRLLKSASAQVPSITLVDVAESFLSNAADSITIARNIFVASVLVPYGCIDCGKVTSRSHSLDGAEWPLQLPDRVCETCGGTTRSEINPASLAPLQKASTSLPEASSKVIARRVEILSRAMTDASVAQAGEAASNPVVDDAILGKYKIVRRLSQGGMAEVFLANQIGIGGFEKPVALKRIQHKLLESRHLAIDMFLNEAKIAGRLSHPNIVQVLDVGEVNGALYLAMEYVRGKDLRDVVKKVKTRSQNFPVGIACYIVREVANALHHAYWSTDQTGAQLSVVHRDVSPHNVIIAYDGSVKLLDFGVAMSAVTEHAQSIVVGKWMYMSPEHSGTSPLDHRSDLFSLGICLYLLVTGSLPFQGNEPMAVIAKIRAGQFRPPLEVAPDLPVALASLIESMLSPNPEERPQSGNEVAEALTEIARSNGIESSATRIADFVAEVFADESNGGDTGRILAAGSGSDAAEPAMTPSEGYPRQGRPSSTSFPTPVPARRSGAAAVASAEQRRSSNNIALTGIDRRPGPSVSIVAQQEPDTEAMVPGARSSKPRVAAIPPAEVASGPRPTANLPAHLPVFGRPAPSPANAARPRVNVAYILVGVFLVALVVAAYFIIHPA